MVESRLDYLTLTSPNGVGYGALWEAGQELLASYSATGDRVRPFQWKGYEGQSCGPVTCGRRDSDSMLRVSGVASAEHAGKLLPVARNVSRCDLAVTVRHRGPMPGLLRTSYDAACARSKELGGVSKVGAIITNRGGATLLLGSRKSVRYGRLYDKHHESNDPNYENCWRWEVEFKGAAATAVALTLRGGSDQAQVALRSVHDYFQGRGVRAPWLPGNCPPLPRLRHPQTDAERQLLWLSTQVRPTVERLSGLYGVEGLRAVLGLEIE